MGPTLEPWWNTPTFSLQSGATINRYIAAGPHHDVDVVKTVKVFLQVISSKLWRS